MRYAKQLPVLIRRRLGNTSVAVDLCAIVQVREAVYRWSMELGEGSGRWTEWCAACYLERRSSLRWLKLSSTCTTWYVLFLGCRSIVRLPAHTL